MMMTATPLFRFAYTRPIVAGLAVGMVLLLADRALSAPLAASPEAFEKEANTCVSAIAEQERDQAIPTGLLQAISLAESGRWFSETRTGQGEIIAWPWTVTTGGKGHFLPNRADAVAFVKSLRADGVKNIDVGCMQINLMHHPKAFTSIDQAFDAQTNAAYAAKFLKSRHAVSKSWIQAAGDYHSKTPKLHQAYRLKVSKLWNSTSQADFVTAKAAIADTAPTPTSTIVQPDRSLTQRFNRAFQMRQNTTINVGGGYARAGQEIANRVNALKPGAHLTRQNGLNRADNFAQRRQAQLAAWRQTNVN